MGQKQSIIIIGGGVVGLCSAYYLRKEGHEVTVLERSPVPSGCSYGNCGMMVPSHFIPLASPGIVAKGLKWMFNSESPFYIRPRFSMELIKWGLIFYRSANTNHVNRTSGLMRDLNLLSRQLYIDIIKNDLSEIDIDLGGLVMYCKSEKAFDEEKKIGEKGLDLGLKVDFLDRKRVQSLEPDIDIDVVGGVHYLDDGFFHPLDFMQMLKNHLEVNGVTFRYNTAVQSFITGNNQVSGIITDRGALRTDQVIVSAGAWSSTLIRRLRVSMPMQAGKGYALSLPDPRAKLKTCCIFVESKVAVTPFRSGIRFGGTMEIAGIDGSITGNRLHGIIKAIPKYFPQFRADDFEGLDVWTGLRPVSADGVPYIGRLNNFRNVIVATGHGMMGMSMGPVTGRIVSDIVEERQSEFDLSLVDPNRFN